MQQPEADQKVQAATAALANGRIEQAARLLDDAMRADPQHAMAQTKQAELALYRKDHAHALALTEAVLATEPNFAPAWHQRASACWLAGRQMDALLAAGQAVAIQPPNPDFRLRLAQFAAWTGHGADTRDALGPMLAAEQHDPVNFARATGMMGELAIAEGRFDDAGAYLDQALRLQPGLDLVRMLRGMNQLRLGRFRNGWSDYAAREAIPALYPNGHPKLADQVWQGQALAGKTLVVTDDQGHGDAIQFFRYLPLLRDRGASHITWRTFPPLVRLLRDAAPYATVLNVLADDARFDFHCNSTSLPRWFVTEPHSIPARIPYLSPPNLDCAMKHPAVTRSKAAQSQATRSKATRSKAAGTKLGGPEAGPSPAGSFNVGRLKVGLVWSGDARHTRDHLRSIPADLFLGLADVPGISFHSLQHEVRAVDRPALMARPAIGRAVEAAVDFSDTAALIAELDLVITVDTGIAHLAGALGKPAWVVLHVAPDWRWLAERTDSPWYPTARLFRVTPHEWLQGAEPSHPESGWGPVLDRVAAALRALAPA